MPRSTPEERRDLRPGTSDYVAARLKDLHVYGDEAAEGPPFLIAPQPSPLPRILAQRLDEIGDDLAAFQTAMNDLYRRSEKDPGLAFVAEYLDRGKGESLLLHGRLNRLKRELPLLIRPDIFVTDQGLKITEVDSVPGGFGILAALQDVYSDIGFPPLGGGCGVIDSFMEAMGTAASVERPTVAVVVSDESADYRPEMQAMARLCAGRRGRLEVLHPREVRFAEDGLALPDGTPIDVLYRFFELFDLKNVPKWELFLYAAKRKTVLLTPPAKPYLEEKLQAALLFHERLEPLFRDALGADRLRRLKDLFPRTWIVDGREAPPQSQIAGLRVRGRPVGSFSELKGLAQSERQRWVLKPSGFSPLAWGSHGVHLGADLPLNDWDQAVDRALEAWKAGESPWVLQEYHKPVVVSSEVLLDDRPEPFDARARYCPYYFRIGGRVRTSGVLVTLCPKDKKIIHGMADAIMAPAAPPIRPSPHAPAGDAGATAL